MIDAYVTDQGRNSRMSASEKTAARKTVGGAKTAWQKLKKNASVIIGERAVFAIVNLAAAAIAVRAIGIEGFGAVALVHSYARLVGDTLRFQSWQAVLRYGAPLLEADDKDGFRRLIGLTIRLDMLALLGSLVLAVFGARFAADLLNWPPKVAAIAPWYALSIIFMISATPTGLLRLFDRFGVLAAQHAVNATIRLIGASLLWVFGASVAGMVAVWFVAAMVSGLYMFGVALSEMRNRNVLPRISPRWSFRALAAGFDGIWRFVFGTNVATMLSSAMPQVATLVVGAFLGTTNAGLYAIARQISDGISKPAKLLGPVIFPEITWLRAKGRHASVGKLLRRAFLAGMGCVAIIALFVGLAGRFFLELVFGPEATAAYELMVLATSASALMVWGFALEPALMSAGRIGAVLMIQIIGAAVFLALLLFGLPIWGLVAAGLAHLAQSSLVFAGRALSVRKVLASDMETFEPRS